MALNIVSKISGNKFLCHKSSFLTAALRRLRRLLCNALIQPHFDYACSVRYLNLTRKLKQRIQTTQQVHFCLFAYS